MFVHRGRGGEGSAKSEQSISNLEIVPIKANKKFNFVSATLGNEKISHAGGRQEFVSPVEKILTSKQGPLITDSQKLSMASYLKFNAPRQIGL